MKDTDKQQKTEENAKVGTTTEENNKNIVAFTNPNPGHTPNITSTGGVDGAPVDAPSNTNPPFDLASIRLRQDFAAGAPVKKALLTVPVRKPNNQEFFRVHPAESHRLEVGLLILKDTGEVYVVTPDVAEQLGSDVAIRYLVLTINRQGVVALWPLAMPDEDGHLHEWGRSALEAANHAKTAWVRLRSNRSLGAYEVEFATATLGDPVWPDVAFAEIVSVAFRGRIIDSVDHPVVRVLKGAM